MLFDGQLSFFFFFQDKLRSVPQQDVELHMIFILTICSVTCVDHISGV